MSGEQAAVAEALAEHRVGGYINSREGWVGCECGAHLPCPMDVTQGAPVDWEQADAIGYAHVATAILEALAARAVQPTATDQDGES